MKLRVQVTHAEKSSKSSLIIGIYDGGALSPTAKILDKLSSGHLTNVIKESGFKGKLGQTLAVFPAKPNLPKMILLVGAGNSNKLGAMGFRKIALAAIRAIATTKADEATSYLCELSVNQQTLAWKVKQLAEASIEGLYRFDQFKSEKEPISTLKMLTIHIPNEQQKKTCEKALQQGQATADAISYTKNLANLPSNICTPTYLADAARQLVKQHRSLTIKVLNRPEMKKMGMGAILGVSQGSAEEPKLICIEYKGASKSKAPIALVGKGITFDTGGNSLKSPDAMVGMKYDMCGAATVLGTIKAAAELKLAINIVGIVPAVENMPGGTAYKPEDILTSLSGQTIEVISTDAEGRLILADALTYCERYKPEVVIDIATLTGAVVIALGFHASGLLSNDDKLAQSLLQAGEESNDRAWRLPLWDEYQDQIKSPFADMANSGGRTAGTITAACFLSRFAKKLRWAHLDVAGTAAMMMGGGDRYATGRPVALLTQFLIDQS